MRSIKSAERTLALLELFSRRQRPLSVGRIVEELDIPQASTSMLLANLTELGYLHYDRDERTYVPSIRVALVGSWIAQQFDEAGSLTRRLKQLQDEVRETVFIGIQNGAYGQYVLGMPRGNPRSMRALTGQMKLLTMSATGRVLLSLKNDAEVLRWVHRCNSEAESSRQQVGTSEFLAVMADVRSAGFAETRGDVLPTFGALAVSISPPTGQMSMALGVGLPVGSIDQKRQLIVEALRTVKEAFE